jgi:predicted transposase/invertase (TIGR01784 family)
MKYPTPEDELNLLFQEIGVLMGIEMGIEIGKEMGIEIAKENTTLKIALNLLTLGLPVEIIKEATGLDKKTILSLKENK